MNDLDSATYYLDNEFELEKTGEYVSGYLFNMFGIVEAKKKIMAENRKQRINKTQ